MQNHDMLLDWLHQTQALEEGAIAVSDAHAPRLGNRHPYLARLLTTNAEKGRVQAIRLRACIDALGGAPCHLRDPSDGLGITHLSRALASVFDDEGCSKGVLALYAIKHLEIGSYRILVRTAERAREADIAAICRHHLAEELDMAGQMEAYLDTLPVDHMRDAALPA
jgi:ferritin-like metal-binding protein YciE